MSFPSLVVVGSVNCPGDTHDTGLGPDDQGTVWKKTEHGVQYVQSLGRKSPPERTSDVPSRREGSGATGRPVSRRMEGKKESVTDSNIIRE